MLNQESNVISFISKLALAAVCRIEYWGTRMDARRPAKWLGLWGEVTEAEPRQESPIENDG